MVGRSQRLKLRDVAEVHRTVREACEMGDEGCHLWREHVVRRLHVMIGSAAATANLVRIPVAADAFRPVVSVFVDFEPEFIRYIASADLSPDPHTPHLIPRLTGCFHETTPQICGQHAWYQSAFFNDVMRKCRYDHYLVSVQGLPEHGYCHILGFSRALGDRDFTQRECRIVGLLHEELTRVWQSPSLAPEPEWSRRLTPRLRDVLLALLEGLSEKEVARRLALRRATVHNHIERLYKTLDVNSRGELLAKARPRPAFRPQLLPGGRTGGL